MKMIWSTSKTFIKNIIKDCWVPEELEPLVDESSIKDYIDQINPELWQECYTTIDYSKWKTEDFEKITAAAKAQLEYISEEE